MPSKRRAAPEATGRDVIPVLFRDSDGTHSAGRGRWEEQWTSIGYGFEAAGCTLGVPMIPKPKSEAWLLCACKENAYQNCAALEDESGNDRAANSLKSQLHVALDGRDSRQELCEAIEDLRIDPAQINMPSFNAFRERLREVIAQACSRV